MYVPEGEKIKPNSASSAWGGGASLNPIKQLVINLQINGLVIISPTVNIYFINIKFMSYGFVSIHLPVHENFLFQSQIIV